MNRFALKREEYVKGIITALTEIVLTIKNLNAAHFYDANTVAEDFFCGFLNKLYGYSLHNMNNIQTNYPGIDLGSKKDGIAVQVTADGKRPKIAYTIRTFINNEYYNDYSRLIVVIIGNGWISTLSIVAVCLNLIEYRHMRTLCCMKKT